MNFPQSLLAWDVIVLNGYLFLNLLIPVYLLVKYYYQKPPNWTFILPFILIAIPWAVGIHTVTAFLYNGLAARPFWNASILAPRFLASALCSGPAIMIIIFQAIRKVSDIEIEDRALFKIAEIMAYAMFLNLFLLTAEMFKEYYSNTVHIASFKYLYEGLHGHNQLVPLIWIGTAMNVVAFEDELWQFRCPWIIGKPAIWRFAGPDIDHMERMDDGTYPEGLPLGWFLGGMWYDASDRKLYAPMHVEMEAFLREHPVARWNARKIALATSADKGKTWHYEGDILTPSTYYYNHDTYKFSGDCYSNGLADFGFYADVRSGYFYLFPEEAWISKSKFWGWWNTRVARCAMKDNMAPGAWRYFYNGTWDEPALGGKSSTVAPSHFWRIIFSTYLQRYMSLFTSGLSSTLAGLPCPLSRT